MDMSDMDDKATCPMIMVFHSGHCERILWHTWVARTVVEFVLSVIAWFFIAFSYEALKYLRQHLHKRSLQSEENRLTIEIETRRGNGAATTAAHPVGCPHAPPPLPEIKIKSQRLRIFSSDHIIQSLLNLVQIVISYLLMMVFMTFNYWLCMAVVFGLGFGYFCFGWIGQQQSSLTEECCS